MVAIVTGAGLGLLDSSANQANGLGAVGNNNVGQAKGSSYVNAATGNLILQFTDETLSGSGADLTHARTYNSLGSTSDGDNDRWRWLGEKRISLHGSLNASGSYLIRTTGDGHEARYDWTGSYYESSDGKGAHDRVVRSGSEWVWTEGSSRTVERYNSSTGWIKNVRDTSGNGFDYSFSGNLLTQIRDVRSGQLMILGYSGGRLAHVDTRATTSASSSSLGSSVRQVYYSYDSSGRLTQVRTDLSENNSISDSNVYTTNYYYDGSSTRVRQISQSDGSTVNFTYTYSGGAYKVSSVTDQTGTTTFSYLSGRTDVTNGAGDTWNYYYDSSQRVTRLDSETVDGTRQSATFTYDSKDNVTRVTDAAGKSVYHTYDSRGNLTQTRDVLGNYMNYSYDGNNQLVQETRYKNASTTGNPSGAETTYYIYDSKQRLRYTLSPEGRVTETRYNSTTGLIAYAIKYAGGSYSPASLSSSTSAREGQLNTWVGSQNDTLTEQTRFDYDYRGNLLKKTEYGTVSSSGTGSLDAKATVTEYVYSAHGQLLQTISVVGSSRTTKNTLESNAYDGMGRVISTTGTEGTLTTSYSAGSISVSNSASGLTSTSAYDSRGKLVSISQSATGESSRTAKYYYDGAGRLTMQEDAEGAREYTFYDAAGRVRSKVDASGAVKEYRYDAAGRLVSETRFANKVSTSTWFNGSSVTRTSISVTAHADDRQTRTIYDSMGRVTYVTEEFGSNDRVENTRYDATGRATQKDHNGRVTRFFYDQDGLLVGTLDADYHLTENVYDDAGRLIRLVRYKNVVSSSYRASGDFTTVKNNVASSEKLFTHYYYDAQGRQVGVVDEQGFFTETIYEPANQRVYTRRYLGIVPSTLSLTSTISNARVSGGYRTTTTNYDNYGRVSTVVSHDGTVNRTIYDAAGRVVKTVQAEGYSESRATRTRYNAFGEVTGMVSGVGEAAYSSLDTAIDQYGQRITLNNIGQQVEVAGPQGQRTLYFYDSANRLSYTLNAEGSLVNSSYNTFGEVSQTRSYTRKFTNNFTVGNTSAVASEADRYGSSSDVIVSSQYNQLGLIKSSTDGENNTTSYTYTRNGEVASRSVSTTQPYYGSASSTVTQYTYDAMGRLTQTVEDAGGLAATTRTIYDGFGRVYRVQDANNGYSYNFYYDQGRRIRKRDADVRYTTEIFDAFGRVKERHDGYSKITRYSYDDTNRVVVMTSAEGKVTSAWRNRVGDVTRTQDGNGNNTYFSYTKDGKLDVTTDAKGYTTDNTYDRSGRVTSTRNANGYTIYYSYDEANQLTTTSGSTVYTVNTYDALGRVTRKVAGTGSDAVRTDYEYDRNGRLTREITDPSGLALSKRYTYTAAGYVSQIETGTTADQAQHVVRYRYDGLGRKTHENIDPNGLNLETRFYYNKIGNLTRTITENGSSDVNVWMIYNKTGQKSYQINGVGEVTKFNYDSNGRLFETYQYYNRLSSTTLNGLGTAPSSVSLPSTNAQDRRSFNIYDDDGMLRFSLTATDVDQWVATENVYDNNGNIIETRRFDKFLPLTESRVNTLDNSSITDSEMITELRALGYRFTNWGDSSNTASGTRRTHFAFDSLNRLRYTVSAVGAITENIFDAMGNVRYQTQFYSTPSLSSYTESSINSALTSTYRNNSANRTKEFQYNSYNRLIREFSATADKIHYWSGSTLYSRNDVRIRTYITYDSLGRVKSREEGRIVNSSGSTVTSSYTRTTNYTYDKASRQIKTELSGYYDEADGRVYRYSASDRFRRSTAVVYDALGNAVRNEIRTGLSTYIYQYKTYDAANRVVHDVDALGYVTKYSYDKASNSTQTRRHNYSFNTSSYRDAGEYLTTSNLSSISTSYSRSVNFTYDLAGRQTRSEITGAQQNYNTSQSASSSTTYGIGSYDYDDTMITNFTYNAFGEQVKKSEQIDNLGRWADSYTYLDRVGREVMAVDAEKYGTKMEYDALGNLTRTTEYADKTSSTLTTGSKPSFSSSSYTQASADRILSYDYDKMGRVTGVRRHNFQYSDHTSGSSYSTRSYSATGYGDSIQTTVYNKFGEATSVTDGDGNRVNNEYNNLGQVTRTYEPYRYIGNSNGTTTSYGRPYTDFAYDVFGNVLQEDRYATAGASTHHYTRHEYDEAGFETRKYVLWSGQTATQDLRIKNDSAGHVIEEKQSVSVSGTHGYSHDVITRYHYDATGRQIATLNVFDGRQSGDYKLYNAFGDVYRSYKARGSSSSSLSDLTKTTAQYIAYDNAGRVRYMRDATGYNYYYYDLRGNVTRHELRGNSTSTSEMRVTESYYDKLGRAVTQRAPRHLVENYNLSTSSTGASTPSTQTPKTTQTYDRWGNVASRTTAGKTTSYQYNHDNKVVYEKGPSVYAWTGASSSTSTGRYYASITRFMDYDLQGNLAKDRYEARSGSSLMRSKTNTYVYNRAGQLIKTYDATNKTKEATYDMLGNKVSTKSGTGIVHVMEYNAVGQTTKRSVLRGSTKVRLAEYKYDQAGRQYQELDASGNAIYNKYDARGKLIENINRNGGKMTYTYDDFGNKTKEVEDHGYSYTTTTTPYGGSPVTTTHNVTRNFEREWTYSTSSYYIGRIATHTGGHLSTATGLTYTYSYNRFGELAAETYSSTRKVEYGYLDNGLRASVKETNGTSTSEAYFGYDIKGNRTRERYSASRQVTTYSMSGSSYGTVTSSTNTVTSGSTTYYQYDDLNRLTKVKAPRGTFYSGSTQYSADLKLMEYRYDEWGNRRAIYVNYTVGSSNRTDTDWFDYDNEGRVTIDSGYISGGRVVAGKSGGTAITYDNDGRRATTEKWQGTTNGYYTYGGGDYVEGYERFQQERFTYNDLGALLTAQKRTVRRDLGDNNRDSYYSATGYSTYETNIYDNRGFKTRSIYNGNRTDSSYNAGGLVTYTETFNSAGQRTGITDNYAYDRMGTMRGYRFRYYDKGSYKFQNTYSYENNATFSSYQNTRISLNSTQGSTEEGVTNNSYDFRGRLVQSTITQRYKDENKTGLGYRYYIYDTDGQIIASRERHAGESSYDVQSYFYQGANSLANFGDLGAHFNPISSIHKGGNSATSYSVNEGDTLSSIAQMIYGDASLWYVIAEANGLSMSPVDRFGSSDAGRSLRVPNSDQSIKNNSTTFKPYNPGEIIGDLTPDAKIVPPPPPKKGGCSKLAMVIMVVVAVVATVVTAGAAAAAIAAAAPALAGTAATMAGAFIGGVVGSLASQATGMALGVVDGISLRQAFASGLTGAFTAGIGAALSSGGSALATTANGVTKLTTLGHALQGAGSVAAGALANKIAGLDSGFSWRSVAAGAVAGAITGSLGLNDNNAKTGNVKAGKFLSAFGKSFASSAINGVVNRAFTKGPKKSYGDIALDSFGNALGSGLAAHFELRKKGEAFGKKLGEKLRGNTAQTTTTAPAPKATTNEEEIREQNEAVKEAIKDKAVAEAVTSNDDIDEKTTQDVVENQDDGGPGPVPTPVEDESQPDGKYNISPSEPNNADKVAFLNSTLKDLAQGLSRGDAVKQLVAAGYSKAQAQQVMDLSSKMFAELDRDSFNFLDKSDNVKARYDAIKQSLESDIKANNRAINEITDMGNALLDETRTKGITDAKGTLEKAGKLHIDKIDSLNESLQTDKTLKAIADDLYPKNSKAVSKAQLLTQSQEMNDIKKVMTKKVMMLENENIILEKKISATIGEGKDAIRLEVSKFEAFDTTGMKMARTLGRSLSVLGVGLEGASIAISAGQVRQEVLTETGNVELANEAMNIEIAVGTADSLIGTGVGWAGGVAGGLAVVKTAAAFGAVAGPVGILAGAAVGSIVAAGLYTFYGSDWMKDNVLRPSLHGDNLRRPQTNIDADAVNKAARDVNTSLGWTERSNWGP